MIGNNIILYLVSFKHDHVGEYCKEIESDYATVLVRSALTFESAREQIINSGKWDNPREFEDLTI